MIDSLEVIHASGNRGQCGRSEFNTEGTRYSRSMINPSVAFFHLGRVPYRIAFNLQKAVVNALKNCENGPPHTVLLLEHTPVYTIGVRSTDPANDYSPEGIAALERLGADFVKTDRGGLITYHGPGQLVAYPILDLRCPRLLGHGLRWYVNALEQAGVQVCARLGLQAKPGGTDDIGVWLSPVQKVMAIGVHKSENITYHGLALNCTDEPLAWFRRVVPCGLVGRDVTSLTAACARPVSVAETVPLMCDALLSVLFGPTESQPDMPLDVSHCRAWQTEHWADSTTGPAGTKSAVAFTPDELINAVVTNVRQRGHGQRS
ncbi:Octanoyltransferase mitochondrial [Fasciola hepatica]|uniref:lipoyl(octanoyl) transferase n=1 Tax=Fasciola hepatica TaxID=6192 RepID=A0A4E0R806_FASHE|nr:Octanoyltransferase mitochondrial [Fasciola hepatica]